MNKNVAAIYEDGTYARKNQGMGDENAAWKAANVLRMMQMGQLDPQSILEVGCGGGLILVELQKQLSKGISFTGYEPMPEAYERAVARTNEHLQFKRVTVDGQAQEKFDLVLCLDVFEHVEDYFTFLRQLRNYGKSFIFHIPLDMNTQMVARGKPIQKVRDEVGHLHYFSKFTALATLEYCGYKIKQHFYTKSWESNYHSIHNSLASLPRRLCHAIAPDLTARILGGLPLMVLAE